MRQYPNSYISPELNFCFHYFFMRQTVVRAMAKALIFFPGGFGTMDEMWEILTLMQTGKALIPPFDFDYGQGILGQGSDGKPWSIPAPISGTRIQIAEIPTTVTTPSTKSGADLERYHLPLDKFI